MILSGQTIQEEIIISPWSNRTVHAKTGTSYGLSHCGYDVRIREAVQLAIGGFMLGIILDAYHDSAK
jgi:hypothetical protein